MILDKKSGSVFSSLSFHGTHPNDWLSDPPRASKERISQQFVSCEVHLLKFVDMSSTKLQSMLPTCRLFDDDQTLSHREFFECFRRFCLLNAQIVVGLQVTCHHIWTEKTIRKPFPGSKLLLWKALEALWQFLLLFSPKGNKTWCKHVLLSLPMKNWRKQLQRLKKKITDRMDLSSRTPRGQLSGGQSRTHTKLEQAELTPLSPPEKNSHYIWVPIYVTIEHLCINNSLTLCCILPHWNQCVREVPFFPDVLN